MRYSQLALCVSILALGCSTWACAPKTGADEPFSAKMQPIKAGTTPQAVDQEVSLASQRLIRMFWEKEPNVILEEALCATRQAELSPTGLDNLIIKNIMLPAGAIQSIEQISQSSFENASGLSELSLAPADNPEERHEKQYANPPIVLYWRLQAQHKSVLIATTVVKEDNVDKLQAIEFKTEYLGSKLKAEGPQEHERNLAFITLVMQNKPTELKPYLGQSIQESYTTKQLSNAIAKTAKSLTSIKVDRLKTELKFLEGWSWNSQQAPIKSYSYEISCPKGVYGFQLHLNSHTNLVESFTWRHKDHTRTVL